MSRSSAVAGDARRSEGFIQLRSVRWVYGGTLRRVFDGRELHDVTPGAYLVERPVRYGVTSVFSGVYGDC